MASKDDPCAKGHDFKEKAPVKLSSGRYEQVRECTRRSCNTVEWREGPSPNQLGKWQPL